MSTRIGITRLLLNRAAPSLLAMLIAGQIGGCPASGSDAAVVAKITISATHGPAPLDVTLSADGSSSRNGDITQVTWDFGDQAVGSGSPVHHTYAKPGRYAIRLSVTDSADQSATDRVDVRVAGESATAIILRNQGSGVTPLIVRFDGTQSFAADDTILDYFWDFGDDAESREARPTHTYHFAGVYTVVLRVVSAGGVEASATATITATAPPASQPTSQPASQPSSQPTTRP